MARRYFYSAAEGLANSILVLVPSAGVTEIDGVIAVVVADPLVAEYDSNQPAAAFLVEEVPEGSDHGLVYHIPAHLLVNLDAALIANNAGQIAAAAGAIRAEANSRAIVIGDTPVPA